MSGIRFAEPPRWRVAWTRSPPAVLASVALEANPRLAGSRVEVAGTLRFRSGDRWEEIREVRRALLPRPGEVARNLALALPLPEEPWISALPRRLVTLRLDVLKGSGVQARWMRGIWLRREATGNLSDELVMGEGLCGVCGEDLRAPVETCRECEVGLHRECWAYAGGCATYGCTGTRPSGGAGGRRSGRRGSPSRSTNPSS